MKRSLYKSILTVLLSALVTAPTVSPIVAVAQTESETDAEEGGETEKVETEEEDKSPPVTDSSFEDENGVQYKWYRYADGTAEIYEMICRRETIVIDIPEEIVGKHAFHSASMKAIASFGVICIRLGCQTTETDQKKEFEKFISDAVEL